MSSYLLEAKYDSKQSFYAKAIVKEYNEEKVLESYGVEVAAIEEGEAYVYNTYSATTLRHIKEFLKQEGFKAENKNQILADYGVL